MPLPPPAGCSRPTDLMSMLRERLLPREGCVTLLPLGRSPSPSPEMVRWEASWPAGMVGGCAAGCTLATVAGGAAACWLPPCCCCCCSGCCPGTMVAKGDVAARLDGDLLRPDGSLVSIAFRTNSSRGSLTRELAPLRGGRRQEQGGTRVGVMVAGERGQAQPHRLMHGDMQGLPTAGQPSNAGSPAQEQPHLLPALSALPLLPPDPTLSSSSSLPRLSSESMRGRADTCLPGRPLDRGEEGPATATLLLMAPAAPPSALGLPAATAAAAVRGDAGARGDAPLVPPLKLLWLLPSCGCCA